MSCTASSSVTSSTGSHSSSSSVLLRLRFRPKVQLLLLGGEREGDTLTFRCATHAFPPVDWVEWRVGGRVVEGEAGGVLRVEGAGRQLEGAVVQCKATNGAGEGRAETRVSLLCE